jgi:ubiquitin C
VVRLRPLNFDPPNKTQNEGDPIDVILETITGKTITFNIGQTETIKALKSKLQDQQDIPIALQHLIYDGKEIENDRTLAYYNIQSQARLYLVLRLSPTGHVRKEGYPPQKSQNEGDIIKIIIRTLTGKTFWFNMNRNETIGALMSKIEDQEGIPIVQQRLIYKAEQLENYRTLAFYDIQHQTTVHLVMRLMEQLH